MKNINEYIKAGLKWTITPVLNDKTGEKLGFTPFELNSKMTASAFLAQYKRETGGDIIAIRPLNIARAAFVGASLLSLFGGKASAKLRNICDDVAIDKAIKDTDTAQAEAQKAALDVRRATAQAERTAIIGASPEKLANEKTALDAFRSVYEEKKIILTKARKAENDLCLLKVAELFPTFSTETENN